MILARAILVVNALTFLFLGAWSLAAPETVASFIDIGLETATARADFMAFYGGFEVGLGLFLAACVARADWVRPGLAALGIGLACTGLGRLAGMLTDGPVKANMATFLAFELGFAALCAIAFVRLSRNGTRAA